MSGDNLDQVKRELRLRELRSVGEEVLQGRELHDFLGIKEKINARRLATEELYQSEYKTRVEVAYRDLLNDAAAKKLDHKPSFFGIDRFNKSDLMRQAQRNVRFDHHRSMERLDDLELKQSESFLDKCAQRKSVREAFKKTAERRRRHERRQNPDRRHSPTMTD